MHLKKLPDGSIRLTRLNPWDVQTFRSLPALADYSQNPTAEKRLLPTPAIDADMSPELAMDWVEYVVPELRESFAENLAVVLADLATLTEDTEGDEGAETDFAEDEAEDEEDADETTGEDESSEDHAENHGSDDQPNDPIAETLTDEAAPLPDAPVAPPVPHYALTIPAGHAEAWFRAMNQARIVLSTRYGIDSEHVPELAKLLEAGHIEYWFQYELFVSLQGWLVEAVLDPE